MAESVTMPALGESVTEGTVTRWLKEVGEEVAVDEPLLEVSTDKVDTEIPSPAAGTLTEILVGEDETVEIGTELARIGGADEEPSGGDTSADAGDEPGAGDEPEAAEEPEPAAAEQAPEPESAPAPAASSAPAPEQGGGSDGGSGSAGVSVTMPALGESVTEGTVTRWLKEVGEEVAVDEPLLEVSTDKVDTEIPSPAAGTLTEILVGEDETVEIGTELARIGGAAGGSSGGAAGGSAEAPAADEADDAGPEETEPAPAPGSDAPPAQVAPEEPQRQVADEAPASAPEPAQASEDYTSAASQLDGSVTPPDAAGSGTDSPSGAAQASGAGGISAYVTPLVRKLAADNGVDLSSLTGTGVGGRIRKQDVLDAAEKAAQPEPEAPAAQEQPSAQAPAAPASGAAPAKPTAAAAVGAKRGTTEKMTRLRKVIASRMVESLQTSAQLTTVVEVDVTRIARLRARAKKDFTAREGVSLSYLPFFALAAVEALKAFPQVNASIEGENIVYHPQENLGVAVDTERGLLVPVIKEAGDLNIAGLAKKIADLAARTRDNKVTPDELGGGTFTLTNTGSRGALFDTPIINQPQVAILGTGTVVKRPVVLTDADGGESIAVRSMVYLALSYDHRLVDGADAARFLGAMKARLEEGAFEGDTGLAG